MAVRESSFCCDIVVTPVSSDPLARLTVASAFCNYHRHRNFLAVDKFTVRYVSGSSMRSGRFAGMPFGRVNQQRRIDSGTVEGLILNLCPVFSLGPEIQPRSKLLSHQNDQVEGRIRENDPRSRWDL